MNKKLIAILERVGIECESATEQYGAFNSAHEGYAILLEEMDELWEIVKMKQKDPNRNYLMPPEAIQVAAMAIRLIHDCCEVDL